jgi:prepilin-type N-terminal cleavage/methylation domain-containing protein
MSRRRRGFSLIEVLFASFVALTCALIYAGTLPVGDRSRAKADFSNRALALAQKQIEGLRSIDPTLRPDQMLAAGLIDNVNPVGPDTYSFTNVDNARFDNPARVLPSGTGRVTVRQVDLELREVVVNVGWRENGRDRSLRLATLVADLNQ